MFKTIKAKYINGMIEPLEKIDITDGTEIIITVTGLPLIKDGLDKSFGGWKDLLEPDEFIKNVCEGRLISTRPEVTI